MSEKIIGQVSTNEIDLEATIDSNGELNGNIETQNALNGTISYDVGLNGEVSNKDTLQGSLGATTLKLSTNKHNELINSCDVYKEICDSQDLKEDNYA